LIVGAGPVGLGAALFLARLGQPTRVVEQRTQPSQESRALAVNPRTLDLLEPTGVTRRMLELGLPMHAGRFYRRGRLVGTVRFDGIHPRYPFMLALSQASTERLLTSALEAAGGTVERGTRLVECRNVEGGVEAVLEPTAGGPREVVHCPWLLAADGARSTARNQLGIDFPGSSFAESWHLADVPLRTTLAGDQAHAFFLDGGGFVFLIRVVDDALEGRIPAPVWRVIATRPEPLSWLGQGEPAGPPLWTSSFHIAHRLTATFSAGGVYLAGDAAHIHSPVGARGMNLGLEDAWYFAQLWRANRLADYERLRRPVDRAVVQGVERLSRVAAGQSLLTRFVRAYLFPLALKLAFVRRRMVQTVTGLDHPLPDLAADADRHPSGGLRAPAGTIGGAGQVSQVGPR
jgi:2-polyprenyl-6-methoxyphenol hydroxylase-like FAD-dependent oxidoreductase